MKIIQRTVLLNVIILGEGLVPEQKNQVAETEHADAEVSARADKANI